MSTARQKVLVVVMGPTAVGKTAVAIEVAKHLKTEIISMKLHENKFDKEVFEGCFSILKTLQKLKMEVESLFLKIYSLLMSIFTYFNFINHFDSCLFCMHTTNKCV